MKKWLILFALVDFIFVGLVLKISSSNKRHIANDGDPFYAELTEGQKNKYDFVKSFRFQADNEKLVLTTDRLQSLCQNDALVELKFKAVNVAYAGAHPSISHIYSCQNIRKDTSIMTLPTSIDDFVALHKTSHLQLDDSEMRATQVYSDEDFPTDWILSDVIVTGELNFTVSSAELAKAHTDRRFEFSISTSVK